MIIYSVDVKYPFRGNVIQPHKPAETDAPLGLKTKEHFNSRPVLFEYFEVLGLLRLFEFSDDFLGRVERPKILDGLFVGRAAAHPIMRGVS